MLKQIALVFLSFLLVLKLAAFGQKPLLPAARRMQAAYLAWKAAPQAVARQQAFLMAFPQSKAVFIAIFYPEDFGQLYSDSPKYFDALREIGAARPSAVLQCCIGVAKTHPTGSDAISDLHETTMQLARRNPRLFGQQAHLLVPAERRELFHFLADVEGISHYPDYDALARVVAEKGFSSYATELRQAKQWRLRQPMH